MIDNQMHPCWEKRSIFEQVGEWAKLESGRWDKKD